MVAMEKTRVQKNAVPLLAIGTTAKQSAPRTGALLAAIGPWLAGGGALYCLDGANVFDPAPLATWARRRQMDPAALLGRVWVSRAYTCHQLAASARTMLSPLLDRPDPVAALVLGVDRLFIDDDLPLHERRHLYDRIADDLEALARKALPVVVTVVGAPDSPWVRPWASRSVLVKNPTNALTEIAKKIRNPNLEIRNKLE